MQGPGAPPPPQYQQPYQQQQQQPYGYGQSPQDQWYAKKLEDSRKGQKLVSTSTWMLAGGALVMLGGCGGGIALQFAPLSFGAGSLGFLVIIAAAVVGQVGRGMQGRVI